LCCSRDCGSQCGNPGSECPAGFQADLNFTPGGSRAIETETGEITVIPEGPTTVTLSGNELGTDGTSIGSLSASLTLDVMAVGDRDDWTLSFAWDCRSRACRFGNAELLEREPVVQIVGVRNTSRFDPLQVGVTGPGPMRVVSDEVMRAPSRAFDGPFGGLWSARLDGEAFEACQATLPGLSPDLVCPGEDSIFTTSVGGLDPLEVEVTFECRMP
jgi:hypothetical protein